MYRGKPRDPQQDFLSVLLWPSIEEAVKRSVGAVSNTLVSTPLFHSATHIKLADLFQIVWIALMMINNVLRSRFKRQDTIKFHLVARYKSVWSLPDRD